MTFLPLVMGLTGVLFGAGPDSLPAATDSLASEYLTRCLDLGEMLDHDFDSVTYRLNHRHTDSIPMGAPLISLGRGVYLGDRRLPCLGPARILRRTDSHIVLGTRPPMEVNPLISSSLPVFSAGVGFSFDAAMTVHGWLPGLMNKSVDSVGAHVGQYQFSPNFDVSVYRMIGFRFSPGFGGNFAISSDKDPVIELSYRETRYGPFLELPLRAFWKDALPVSLRLGYLWIDGRLELDSDTLRQNLLGYSGQRRVYVDVEGRAWNYSLIIGDRTYLHLDFYRRSVDYEHRPLTSGASLGMGIGGRI